MRELPIVAAEEEKQPILLVSPQAAEVFRAGLADRGAKAVRVTLEPAVDGQVRFRLAMAGDPQPTDTVFQEMGVTFYMDAETARDARGTVIEYQDGPDGGRFLLGMPHRHGGGGCGCGGHGGASGGGHGAGGCACGHGH
jgi:Fe-S cluster assembly iron-binding protein IscA